jgi:hypothetical protein
MSHWFMPLKVMDLVDQRLAILNEPQWSGRTRRSPRAELAYAPVPSVGAGPRPALPWAGPMSGEQNG